MSAVPRPTASFAAAPQPSPGPAWRSIAARGVIAALAWLAGAGTAAAWSPGPYLVSITSSPPIGQGIIVVQVRDRATRHPAVGGTLLVKAFMPSMPMGETWKRAVPVPGQPGEFQQPWPFVMAGDWEIQAEYHGPEGTSEAAVHVSPGSIPFPIWAKILLGLLGLGFAAGIANLARTRNGRERLKTVLQPKNLFALLILAGVGIGSWLLVQKLTAGSVDWNKMSMQMEDYTAPAPVAVAPVRYGSVSSLLTYTGTAAPYVEDTIYPRVTGRIVSTLYPGDHVTAGQVVVQLEQPDLVAKAEQARFAVAGAEHDLLEAQDRVQQALDALSLARAAAQGNASGVQEAEQTGIGAASAVTQAESDLQTAREGYRSALAAGDQARAAVEQAKAKLASARADAAYWQQEIPREALLLAHGAVSRDEYQGELAKSQAAAAAVDEAQASVTDAGAGVARAQSDAGEAASRIRAAQAQVAQAVADRGSQTAKVSEARAAALGSRSSIASAATAVQLARHQVTHSGAMLDRARAAQAEAEANLGYLTLRAPESGVVTKRLADPGTVVSPGTGLLKIAQIDRIRLQANVSTADLDQIHLGDPVTAVVQGASIQARVTDVFPAASPESHTAVVEAVVPNPGGRLLPGEFVTLQFHGEAARPALVVPVTAVVSLAQAAGTGSGGASGPGGGSGVWIATDGTAHLAPVQLGASDGANQEILGGLRAGDLVIVSGIEGLTEGAPITYPGMPQLSPGSETRTPRPSAAAPTGLTTRAGDFNVALSFTPSPPRVGEEQLRFTITDASGKAVNGAVVSVTSEMPSMSMSGPSGTAHDGGNGIYTLPLTIGMGAAWRVTATVTPPGGPLARAVFNFEVK